MREKERQKVDERERDRQTVGERERKCGNPNQVGGAGVNVIYGY